MRFFGYTKVSGVVVVVLNLAISITSGPPFLLYVSTVLQQYKHAQVLPHGIVA